MGYYFVKLVKIKNFCNQSYLLRAHLTSVVQSRWRIQGRPVWAGVCTLHIAVSCALFVFIELVVLAEAGCRFVVFRVSQVHLVVCVFTHGALILHESI